MDTAFADLASQSCGFDGDLIRNIKGIEEPQDLFDDLWEDEFDRDAAIAVESLGHVETRDSFVTRPFDYGVAYPFEAANWQATRFSDGTSYGVWYGSPEKETTVYETVFHWHRFVMDSFSEYGNEITVERRVLKVHCDALLIDLRGKEVDVPPLVDRTNYDFCQRFGAYLVNQNQNGVLTPSARCDGTNAALFRQQPLSNVSDMNFLTYKMTPPEDLVIVECRGDVIKLIQPSTMT